MKNLDTFFDESSDNYIKQFKCVRHKETARMLLEHQWDSSWNYLSEKELKYRIIRFLIESCLITLEVGQFWVSEDDELVLFVFDIAENGDFKVFNFLGRTHIEKVGEESICNWLVRNHAVPEKDISWISKTLNHWIETHDILEFKKKTLMEKFKQHYNIE
jgi:hypothetical protein